MNLLTLPPADPGRPGGQRAHPEERRGCRDAQGGQRHQQEPLRPGGRHRRPVLRGRLRALQVGCMGTENLWAVTTVFVAH